MQRFDATYLLTQRLDATYLLTQRSDAFASVLDKRLFRRANGRSDFVCTVFAFVAYMYYVTGHVNDIALPC